jgi:hypothetical protein
MFRASSRPSSRAQQLVLHSYRGDGRAVVRGWGDCQDNKLEKLLHLVGDLFELHDDARTYKL